MKYFNRTTLVLLFFCVFQSITFGQDTIERWAKWKEIKPLSIGDTCPDFKLSHIINYPQVSTKLSDFKGKWLILDFWATWCAPCVAMLPKTAELEHKFEGKIQFIPITMDKEEKVRNLFSKLNRGKGVDYTTVTADYNGEIDTLTHFLFQRKTIPHYVWIDPEGIIRAITDHHSVTEERIELLLNNKYASLPLKNDNMGTDSGTKFLEIQNVSSEKEIFHSVITGYRNDGRTSLMYNVRPDYVYFQNVSIAQLYRYAYAYKTDTDQWPHSRTILETDNNLLFEIPNDHKGWNSTMFNDWSFNNSYCYSLKLPEETYGIQLDPNETYLHYRAKPDFKKKQQAMAEIMLSDLNKIFKLKPSFEYRETETLVLSCTDATLLSNENNKFSISTDKVFSIEMKNGTMGDFTKILTDFYWETPVINQTAYTGKFDIELKTDIGNLSELNIALKAYGLKMEKQQKALEVLVLRN